MSCGHELLPLARGEEKVLSVGREGDPVRIVACAGDLGLLAPDHVQPFEVRRAFEYKLRPTDHGAARAARSGLGPV
jgi:hypothetical protein